MNSSEEQQKITLEQTVDRLEHIPASPEKHKLAEQASTLHEKMTGHPMEFDKDDNLITTGPEADQCPALHHKKD
ncbi:hypothetical protein BJV82DRAFT_610614 [Fennellomyces sp. T-0311]|nr:hypothetical protein BJV82DRAFT_610614 [Fennellomyces sp. T-0311]